MADEKELAKLIADYYRREIGVAMQQAEHWHKEGVPLAVHYRLVKADRCFQVVVMMERWLDGRSKVNPFDKMRADLARDPIKPLGAYPPSQELHDLYHDPRNVVKTLQARIDAGLKWY